MANFHPATTGLPMTVWVLPGGRVKVNATRGQRDLGNAAVMVATRPTPMLIEGALSPADQAIVAKWIAANTDALKGYWRGEIDTAEFVTRLVKI